MQLISLNDLQRPSCGLCDGCGQLRSLVASIGEDALEERREAARAPIKDKPRAIAILHIGRVNDDIQQETERVDEDMPLAARALLARIEAPRVERAAPF